MSRNQFNISNTGAESRVGAAEIDIGQYCLKRLQKFGPRHIITLLVKQFLIFCA